jgi:Rps23 Pro-64 3,4-dihydroxylase Tpa1-like proline 4-hydroxylase
MPNPPLVTKKLVSGREIFICDHFVSDETALRVGHLLKTLSYRRSERSRPDLPASAFAAEISPQLQSSEVFFAEMRRLGEDMFPQERFETERVYVNNAVYGDAYFAHRDCDPALHNVTVLYYGNLNWHADWGGETLFYNDQHDAELAVTPRPGRFVVSRGAILHRGGVPSRVCNEERLTIAYKLTAV